MPGTHDEDEWEAALEEDDDAIMSSLRERRMAELKKQ